MCMIVFMRQFNACDCQKTVTGRTFNVFMDVNVSAKNHILNIPPKFDSYNIMIIIER